MDAIKSTIAELTENFNTRMAEFQQNLQSAIPATSPMSHIAAQFTTFRNFVLGTLENLQLQVKLLSKNQNDLETRSRRKILLIHGIPENKNEKITQVATKVLSDHFEFPELASECVSRCHRFGHTKADKPRPILVKFRDLALKNKLWFAKTALKNSGITLSEFLIKERHAAFVAARHRFGLTNCWTRDGNVIVIAPDGARHRIYTVTDLDALCPVTNAAPRPVITTTAGPSGSSSRPSINNGNKHPQFTKSKRAGKK